MHSIDLEDFKYGGTNITAFRIVDPNNPEVVKVVRNWILGEKRFPSRKVSSSPFIKVMRSSELWRYQNSSSD